MKKMFSVLLFAFVSMSATNACTTFFLSKNGQLAFGRNYDWVTDAGMVSSNLRGLAKTSMKSAEGKPISWVSKYGSITFNQYGKEFPTGGMNETGLVVEMMWLDGSQYPRPDKRAALNVLQWIQYELDNYATVQEVISSNKKVRISPQGNPPVHYLVADANGDAATIEFLNGKMVVHKGKDLPLAVLTNTAYATSSQLAMDFDKSNRNAKSDSYSDNSVNRFASACTMVRDYQKKEIDKPIVDYSFDILSKVNQPEFTKWSIVYDLSNKVVYFKTVSYQDVKSVAFADIDMSCSSQPLAFDMNQEGTGNVSQQLKPFSNELNNVVLSKAVTDSRNQVPITDDDVRNILAYASEIKCHK